ncbi:MAG: acyl carrier protein [Actinobacteria bacterium]|nr:acyl carrier protein [Actinomycetota bacterium]
MNNTASLMRAFVNEALLDEPFAGDPLAEGRLDSLALEQLLVFIEDDLGVIIEDDEITPETFSSLDSVASLVDSKRRP